jgi:hypothetical protein
MSMDTAPEAKPPANRTKLILIVVGALIVVLLAIIAISVSSQAIRAGEEAAAKESAVAEASKMAVIAAVGEKALADLKAKEVREANQVCEQHLLKRRPTADLREGLTVSTFKASDGSYDTKGSYFDTAYPNTLPVQFVCSSIKGNGTGWTVYLKPEK